MTEHRYQGYDHPELYRMINSGPGVSASIPVEQAWKAIATTLKQIDDDLHRALGKLGAGWESDAADAATGALSPLADWAGYAETGATTMESSARYQGQFIADARKKMPEPKPVTTEAPGVFDKIVGAATGPIGVAHVIGQQIDHERQEAAQDNAAAQAVKVMEDYQSDSRWNSSTLGEFPEPPQVVIDTPPPGDTGTGNSNVGYTSKGTGSPVGTNSTTTPSWTPPPTTLPPTTPVPHLPPTDTTQVSWTDPGKTPPPQPPHHPPTNLPVNEPPQNRPVPGPGPVFTRPTTGVPGGGGAGGVKGGALGGGKPFGPMSGSLGAGAQGAMKPGSMPMSGFGGAEGARGGAMGAAGGAGKAGAAGGMGAGGAPGQRGEGEDDIEHKAADYLVETDDVFGDDRLVAPPVIGGLPE